MVSNFTTCVNKPLVIAILIGVLAIISLAPWRAIDLVVYHPAVSVEY